MRRSVDSPLVLVNLHQGSVPVCQAHALSHFFHHRSRHLRVNLPDAAQDSRTQLLIGCRCLGLNMVKNMVRGTAPNPPPRRRGHRSRDGIAVRVGPSTPAEGRGPEPGPGPGPVPGPGPGLGPGPRPRRHPLPRARPLGCGLAE